MAARRVAHWRRRPAAGRQGAVPALRVALSAGTSRGGGGATGAAASTVLEGALTRAIYLLVHFASARCSRPACRQSYGRGSRHLSASSSEGAELSAIAVSYRREGAQAAHPSERSATISLCVVKGLVFVRCVRGKDCSLFVAVATVSQAVAQEGTPPTNQGTSTST